MHRLTDAKKYLQKAGDTKEAKEVADVILAMEGKAQWRKEGNKIVITER